LNSLDKSEYLHKYNERLDLYGYDARSIGWAGGLSRQNTRFKALTSIGVKPFDSVIDLGCGFGDLNKYLSKQIYNCQYVGIDINEKLLAIAREMNPEVDFHCLDILEDSHCLSSDWVIASGIFNARLRNEGHLEYVKEMMVSMFAICKKGISVDFMTTNVDYMNINAFHLDPANAIKLGNELSSRINLKMDYLKYEFNLQIYK